MGEPGAVDLLAAVTVGRRRYRAKRLEPAMTQQPEALVPDVWRCEPAPCPNCGEGWHAEPRGTCETSCLAPVVIHPQLAIPPNVVLGED